MSIRTTLVASTMIGLAALAPARGETLRLGLDESVARALTDGAAAKLATLEVTRAATDVELAKAALRPHLQASVGYSNQSFNLETFGFVLPGLPAVIPPFDVLDARLGAAMDVLSVAAHRRLDAARHGANVTAEERRATENDVAAAVASLYVSVLASRARVEETAANVDLFEKVAASTDRQLGAGMGTRVDVTRAEVQLDRQRDALLAARNEESRARLDFLQAIGAPLDAELELIDPLLDRQAEPLTLEAALELARAGRPELHAADERRLAAKAELSSAKGLRLPTVSVSALGEYSGNYGNNLLSTRAYGVQVAVPLDLDRSIATRVAQSDVRAEEARVREEDLARTVERQVRDALLTYDNAKSRVELALRNQDLAQEELSHASDRFENGVTNALEVDNAQTNVTAAADRRVAALASQAEAWFDLERATGRIRALLPADRR
jgi:outer membrane protein TolC